MVLRDVRGMYNDLDASLLNGRNEISACRQDEKSNTIGIYTTSAATYDVLPCLGDRVSFLCAARVVIFATSLKTLCSFVRDPWVPYRVAPTGAAQGSLCIVTELLSRGSLEDVIREGGLRTASYALILNLALQVRFCKGIIPSILHRLDGIYVPGVSNIHTHIYVCSRWEMCQCWISCIFVSTYRRIKRFNMSKI